MVTCFCSQERREKQKTAPETKSKNEEKPSKTIPTNQQGQQNKNVRRRRVQIEEVNGEKEVGMRSLIRRRQDIYFVRVWRDIIKVVSSSSSSSPSSSSSSSSSSMMIHGVSDDVIECMTTMLVVIRR